ncbi:MAG TPA: hypothetical protein VLV83_11800 [Acidobacteriota bacterium]|nr:hypothetical protein [Acidobacteriota bacterium]
MSAKRKSAKASKRKPKTKTKKPGGKAGDEGKRKSVPGEEEEKIPPAQSVEDTPRASDEDRLDPVPKAEASRDAGQDCWQPDDYPPLEICWTLEEEAFRVTVALDFSASYTVSPPPDSGKMVFVNTVLSEEDPAVPFSLVDGTSTNPFISGELAYGSQGSPPSPSLSVNDLKYPGGFRQAVRLYPQE